MILNSCFKTWFKFVLQNIWIHYSKTWSDKTFLDVTKYVCKRWRVWVVCACFAHSFFFRGKIAFRPPCRCFSHWKLFACSLHEHFDSHLYFQLCAWMDDITTMSEGLTFDACLRWLHPTKMVKHLIELFVDKRTKTKKNICWNHLNEKCAFHFLFSAFRHKHTHSNMDLIFNVVVAICWFHFDAFLLFENYRTNSFSFVLAPPDMLIH